MVIGAFFAGALGGALSVLLNMRRHAAQEYGYFDRKYGLRGLTLPLLGALYGVLLALVWAAVSYFLALDTTNVWLDALPTLIAFWVGLHHNGDSVLNNLIFAETMAFVTLSTSELIRAFTARSERYPVLKMGVFSNKWMNYAVLASLAMVLLVVYVPFLNPIFKTTPLGWEQWELILPLLLIPSIVAEVVKWLTNRSPKKAQ